MEEINTVALLDSKFFLSIPGNVVPPVLSVTFDIRIANDIKLDEFEKMVCKFYEFDIFE